MKGATSVTILDPWNRVQRSTSPIMVGNFSSASPLSYQRCQTALLPSRDFCVQYPSGTEMSVLEVEVHKIAQCGHYNVKYVSFDINGPSVRIAQSQSNIPV